MALAPCPRHAHSFQPHPSTPTHTQYAALKNVMKEADELLLTKFHAKCTVVPANCEATSNVCFQGGDQKTCTKCAATYTYIPATNSCAK